ncbi:hypothetical protein [Acidianus bottle-shaped virus 2 strain ABV2]|uniref:Uncharacterized protein n=1 Tax=Acidianus bottle-shaped virus 2 strain ABV2 TaxID=1732173 RepID=A0A0N9NXX0_9VIRU|nr:hypothetical protein AVU01_gp50 [Acidianus bottle-shaped virus 2 strain ABV2]ALG96798.1 hypothetical protein [Acidianus bottle-shaped virus 2 strain ABV2]
MDKTLINHLEVSTSNLNSVSYSVFSTIRSLIESGRTLNGEELTLLLKSFKSQFTVTLDDLQYVYHECEVSDPIYPYLNYYDDVLNSAYSSLDELIYLIEKEFDYNYPSLEMLIKSTLSSIQDVIYFVHEWFAKLRDNNELTNTPEEPNDNNNENNNEKESNDENDQENTEDESTNNEDNDYPKDEPDEDFYPQEK